MPSPAMGECACDLARSGYFVFPMIAGTKNPLVKWRDGSTSDLTQIAKWWQRWPNANIGVDCGKSGIIVVDVDGTVGIEAWKTLKAAYEQHHCDLWAGRVITPKGRHYWYRAVDGPINSQSVLGPNIDVRANGGLVVAPPSLHKSGERYRWSALADLAPRCSHLNTYPQWLVDHEKSVRAIMAEQASARAQVRIAQLASRWGSARDERHPAYLAARTEGILRTYIDGEQEGNRNRSLFRAVCTLLEQGLVSPGAVYDHVLDRALARGLTAGEVRATVASAVRRNGGS